MRIIKTIYRFKFIIIACIVSAIGIIVVNHYYNNVPLIIPPLFGGFLGGVGGILDSLCEIKKITR